MKSHQEVAKPYKNITHNVSGEDFDTALATSHMLSAETGFNVRGQKQAVPVNVVRGLSDIAVVSFMAVTDEPGRTEVGLHSATMSAITGANILTIGNPGVEHSKLSVMEEGQRNTLTWDQARELYHGDFDKVAEGLAHAAMEALEREGLEQSDVVIVAPSLAGSTASASIKHMIDNGVNLRGVGMIDPVGLGRKSGLARLKQFSNVDASAAPYLEANHPRHAEITESMSAWIKRSANSLPANFLYGVRGVSLGGAKNSLLSQADTIRRNDVSLRIYAAGASEFNTAPKARETTEELARRGVDADLTVIDGASHAMAMMSAMHARVVEDFQNDLDL